MAKMHSGLFHLTHGDRFITGTNPLSLAEMAFKYAENIFKNGTSNEKRDLNTITIVYDDLNDKYYYGMNKGIELHNSPKNAILFGDETHDGILPKTSLNRFPLGNCAEVDAINNALNDGAKLENLHITTLNVCRRNIRMHKIIGKKACENCTATFKGRIKENNTGWEE